MRPSSCQRELVLGHARPDCRQQRCKRAIGDGAGRGNPLQLRRLLDRPVRLHPAFDRHEIHLGRRSGELGPERMADEPRFHADPPRPEGAQQFWPAGREVVRDRLDAGAQRVAAGLDGVSAVGEHHDLVAADEELPRVPGDLLLAIAEHEAGQVAHVLAPDPEVRVQAVFGQAQPHPMKSLRPARPIGIVPAGECRGVRRGREIGSNRPSGPRDHRGHPAGLT